MPDDLDNVTDDYVAQLLAKDAKEVASRASKIGRYDAFLKRPTLNAPKPNTRFLKNIIKETDSHNTALRAKESHDSRARLRTLAQDARQQRDDSSWEAEQRSSKRRRLDDSRSKYEDPERRRTARSSRGEHHRDDRSRSPSRRSRNEEAHDDKRLKSRRDHTRSHRDRYEYERDQMKPSGQRPHRSRHRTSHDRTRSSRYKTADRHRTSSVSSNGSIQRNTTGHRRSRDLDSARGYKTRETSQPYVEARDESPSAESDPLESIVGPAPPPPKPTIKARGRGALTATSGSKMDAHFAQNYDPTDDAHPDPDLETDDWDQALEALRDRQKWQQRGAERLRAAGFSEDEVSNWAQGSHHGVASEKSEADVRWKGRGESREWDRGKVVGAEGVSTQAEWGRLT